MSGERESGFLVPMIIERLEVRGWRLEVRGWRLEVRGWRLEVRS